MTYDISMLTDKYSDWRSAFEYACKSGGHYGNTNVAFKPEDVAEILGAREGENDGANWLMYGRLKDGRYFYLSAGCDYTGWDCQAGGFGDVAPSLEECIRMAMDEEGREVFGLKVPT